MPDSSEPIVKAPAGITIISGPVSPTCKGSRKSFLPLSSRLTGFGCEAGAGEGCSGEIFGCVVLNDVVLDDGCADAGLAVAGGGVLGTNGADGTLTTAAD